MTALTASDLRWMEDRRRRAALSRLLTSDDRALGALGLRRPEIQQMLALPSGADLCAAARGRPALARRLGCPA